VGSERRALCGLSQFDGSSVLDDLRVPPGNRLDAVTGNRRGQHSIRSNDRWRVCLAMRKGGTAVSLSATGTQGARVERLIADEGLQVSTNFTGHARDT